MSQIIPFPARYQPQSLRGLLWAVGFSAAFWLLVAAAVIAWRIV